MAQPHVVIVTVYLYDRHAQERRSTGRPLVVGRSGDVHVPTPAEMPYLLRVDWSSGELVTLTDGYGNVHSLRADERFVVEVGPVSVRVELLKVVPLRRSEPFPWYGSLAFFTVLMAATLGLAQGELVYRYRCDWGPIFGWECPVQNQMADSSINAEYIARLLRQDYAGEEQGVVEQETPTQVHEVAAEFIPAGDAGPPDEFGGSENTTPDPVRSTEETPAPPAAPKPVPTIEAVEGMGTPVQLPAEPEVPVDGEADADGGFDTDAPDEPELDDGEAPTEEKRGWGFRDWIDAETREVAREISRAQRRLRIDPDDPAALGVLAYYQYLGQDYESAERTFDRIIELMPDSSHGYNNKALVYKRTREYQKEEALYRVALAMDPSDGTAMNNLAVNLAHQGRFGEALAYMKRLEAILPDDPYSDLHRSKIHAEMGQEALALRYLDEALAGMAALDTLHHIEFRQDIRVDPSYAKLREDPAFHAILRKYYGEDAPVRE